MIWLDCSKLLFMPYDIYTSRTCGQAIIKMILSILLLLAYYDINNTTYDSLLQLIIHLMLLCQSQYCIAHLTVLLGARLQVW